MSCDLHAIAAQLIEQRFARMRERRDFGEAERRAAALDGVRDAEDRVDQLRLRFADVQLEQRSFHLIERFIALVEEGVVELCEIESHDYLSTRSIVAMSCAGSKGFTIQPVAPASLPARLRSGDPSVVSIKMGVWRYASSARSARMSSMPSIFGMFTSERIRSKERVRASASASSPSVACVTSKPAPVSAMRTMSRIDGESSTVRTCVIAAPLQPPDCRAALQRRASGRRLARIATRLCRAPSDRAARDRARRHREAASSRYRCA